MTPESRQRGLKLAYRLRGLLLAPPLAFVLLSCDWEVENYWIAFGLGGLLFGLGLAIRVWAQTHLHYRLSVKKQLTTTGPYAHVRNPIYIGTTSILLGACFMSELLWFAPVMLAWCFAVYHLATKHEETRLLARYGRAYEQYRDRTPRWIPRMPRATDSAERPAEKFLWPSVLAEAHNLALVIPFVLKDLLH